MSSRSQPYTVASEKSRRWRVTEGGRREDENEGENKESRLDSAGRGSAMTRPMRVGLVGRGPINGIDSQNAARFAAYDVVACADALGNWRAWQQ